MGSADETAKLAESIHSSGIMSNEVGQGSRPYFRFSAFAAVQATGQLGPKSCGQPPFKLCLRRMALLG